MSDLRRHERIPGTGKVRISWQENGEQKMTQAAIVNTSTVGMRLKLSVAIPARTYLAVQDIQSPVRNGSCSVRYCHRERMNFEIGVEFSTPFPPPKLTR